MAFCTCSEPFERTRFLTYESQLKNKIVQSSFYLQYKSKTRLRSYILVLNFVRDLAQVRENKAHWLLQYFSCK